MKNLALLLSLICTFAMAQNSKIYPKSKIIPGEENVFIYEPPKGTVIPESVFVEYIASGHRKSPLKKVNNKYEFIIKAPDSAKTALIIFKDKKETFLDNNSNKAYTYYLKNSNDGKAEIARLDLMDFANYIFKLNYPAEKIASEYETLFQKYPNLKNDNDSYLYYLNAVTQNNPEKATELKKLRIKELETKGGEKNITNAYYLYQDLKETEKADVLEKHILTKYPKGDVAKSSFVRGFMKDFKESGQKMTFEKLNQFMSELKSFKQDNYDKYLFDELRANILQTAVDERNWTKINETETLFSDKFWAARVYNPTSWKIADGDNINSEGKDLDFAEKLARRTLDIYYEKMKNLDKYDEQANYDHTFMFYTDALAMILYKQKKYQQAFDEQSKLINFDFIDDSNRERYVIYAEKVKENDFVKKYIERLLQEKNISDNLFNKLVDIYKSQNLSVAGIEKLREENKKIATKKARQELTKYYGGNLKANDFTLTNLEGKTVKLSDYRGKIVVLDFWATWCGPCREALPHMQELVNQYKGSDVEFFFINTQENKKAEETRKNVSKFIADHKYNLNVLFDFEDSVSRNYKVQGIPTEIIIDKEGNIISRSEGYDGNLGALIKENL